MDKLKAYLLRSRNELDVDSPADETWDVLASKMQDESGSEGKLRRLPVFSFSRPIMHFAAAACVIALAGVGLWWVMKDKKVSGDTAVQRSKPVIRDSGRNAVRKEEKTSGADVGGSTSDIARNSTTAPAPKAVRHKTRRTKPAGVTAEIEAIDKSYSTLIDYQLKKLRATPLYAENGNYFSFYVDQFKQMDQDEQQVRNDIKAYGLTNEFLEQLINVYQQKLNLLKNLQAEINKMNNKVLGRQSPLAKTEVYHLNI